MLPMMDWVLVDSNHLNHFTAAAWSLPFQELMIVEIVSEGQYCQKRQQMRSTMIRSFSPRLPLSPTMTKWVKAEKRPDWKWSILRKSMGSNLTKTEGWKPTMARRDLEEIKSLSPPSPSLRWLWWLWWWRTVIYRVTESWCCISASGLTMLLWFLLTSTLYHFHLSVVIELQSSNVHCIYNHHSVLL